MSVDLTALGVVLDDLEKTFKGLEKTSALLRAQLDRLGDLVPPPEQAEQRRFRGLAPWFVPFGKADVAGLLRSDLVDSLSLFCRPSDIQPDPTKASNLEPLRQIVRLRDEIAPGKGIALMVIVGTEANGLTPAWMAGLDPRTEVIDAGDGKRYPAFWSPTFKDRWQGLWAEIAGDETLAHGLDQVRITISWGQNGEPWGLNRDGVPAEFVKKATAFGHLTIRAEADLPEALAFAIAEHAGVLHQLFPDRVAFSLATGFAFGDNIGKLPDTDPGKHPWFYNLAARLRRFFPNREVVSQHNGAGPNAGASGYGLWLSSSLGPNGASPGIIGAQAVGGCVKDVTDPPRLAPGSKMADTITTAAAHGCRFFEIYLADAHAAIAGQSDDGKAIAAAIKANAGKWAP